MSFARSLTSLLAGAALFASISAVATTSAIALANDLNTVMPKIDDSVLPAGAAVHSHPSAGPKLQVAVIACASQRILVAGNADK